MGRLILVVAANQEECREMCALLESEHYTTLGLDSLESLAEKLEESRCHAVTLDLDSLPVTNRFIRDLRKQRPGLCILVLSERPFHPDLVEAMSNHVYACIRKPLDPEELIYVLRSTCV